MNNNNQYPPASAAMGVLPPSQFALTTATFSASGANSQDPVPPQPQTDNSAASATPQTITADTTGQSLRPLWRNGEKTFPYKVYDMLEFAETSGSTDICSWLPSGESFVIHDRKLFTEFILPRFFLHKKWRSFVSILCASIYIMCALTSLASRLPCRKLHSSLPHPTPPSFFYYRLVNSTFGASDVTLTSQYLMRIVIHSLSVGKWPKLPA
jgi:hypothetical protein